MATHPEQFRGLVGDGIENADGPQICIGVSPTQALSSSDDVPIGVRKKTLLKGQANHLKIYAIC